MLEALAALCLGLRLAGKRNAGAEIGPAWITSPCVRRVSVSAADGVDSIGKYHDWSLPRGGLIVPAARGQRTSKNCLTMGAGAARPLRRGGPPTAWPSPASPASLSPFPHERSVSHDRRVRKPSLPLTMINDALAAPVCKPATPVSTAHATSTTLDISNQHIAELSKSFGISILDRNAWNGGYHHGPEEEVKIINATIQDLVDKACGKIGSERLSSWEMSALKDDLELFRGKLQTQQCVASAEILKVLERSGITLDETLHNHRAEEESHRRPCSNADQQFRDELIPDHLAFAKVDSSWAGECKSKLNKVKFLFSFNLSNSDNEYQELIRAIRRLTSSLSPAVRSQAGADILKMLEQSLAKNNYQREKFVARIAKVCPDLNIKAMSPEACELILNRKNHLGDLEVFALTNYSDEERAKAAELLATNVLHSAHKGQYEALELVSLLFWPGMGSPRCEATAEVASFALLSLNSIWDKISRRPGFHANGIETFQSYNELRKSMKLAFGETPSNLSGGEVRDFVVLEALNGSRVDETLAQVMQTFKISSSEMRSLLKDDFLDLALMQTLADRPSPPNDLIPWLQHIGLSAPEIKAAFSIRGRVEHFLHRCADEGYGASHLNLIREAGFSFDECERILSRSFEMIQTPEELKIRTELLEDLRNLLE
ncbi:hypothetical protein [Variovorax saccharolyticus]|uniref:hypothetical protein n=1 Tax=Variovorax saccharolyticus TaxID=3053516 RepID=UPI002578275F|nr:hypothetical protein [Variovorax sp. J31P216]MDM0029920.1 hypothetical protein [Variovorax sp. J31P216]